MEEEHFDTKDENGMPISIKFTDLMIQIHTHMIESRKFMKETSIITVKNGGGRDRIFIAKDFFQWLYDKYTLKGLSKTIFSYVGFASLCITIIYTLVQLLNT
jgi:hypothetical protein